MTIYHGSKDDDRISKSPQVFNPCRAISDCIQAMKHASPTFAQPGDKPALETGRTMSIQQQFQCVSDDEDEVSLKVVSLWNNWLMLGPIAPRH
jgi:hypothetical protein